jgi:hypothetical protein
MKTLKNALILCGMLFSGLWLPAQPQVSWRFANPAIVRMGSTDLLEFDVQVKSSTGGTYLFSAQFNLTFNNNAFYTDNVHTTVLRSGISNEFSTLLNNYKYAILRNNTGVSPDKVINVALTPSDATILEQSPGPEWSAQLSTQWQTFTRMRIAIINDDLSAGISFIQASMNGQITYHTAPGQVSNYANPNHYEPLSLNLLYLGRIYSASSGWTQTGEEGINWSMAANTSIFDGNATLTAPDKTIALAGDMNIMSGAVLTIQDSKWLTVEGTLTSDMPENLLIHHAGSLIHNSGQVKATLQRNITGGSINASTHRYHLIGIPMHTSNLYTAGQLFMGLHLWELDAANQSWNNISLSGYPVNNLEGYLLWHENASHLLEIPGLLNADNLTLPDKLLGNNYDGHSYRLIPNPYASALQWIQPPGYDAAVYFFEAETGNYVSFADGVPGPSIVPAGQSFFVKSSNPGGTAPEINIDRNSRLHHVKDLYKNVDVIPELLSIRAQSNLSHDVTHIRFHTFAGSGFDTDKDALKLFGFGDAPQLYTIAEGQNYSINTLQTNNTHMTVPLAFQMNSGGNVMLESSGLQSFPAEVVVYLEDTYLNTMINLSEQCCYGFEHQPDLSAERFILHFYNVLSAGNLHFSQGKIWAFNRNVYISMPLMDEEKVLVELFDMKGSILHRSQHSNSSPIVVFGGNTNQVILVKVTNGRHSVTRRVFIF